MDVTSEIREEIVVVSLVGSLDAASCESLAAYPAPEQPDCRIAISMASLDFIDSTGLGALVGLIRRVRENDGQVAICSPPPTILRTLQLASINKLVPITQTIGSAMLSLRGETPA